MLLHSVLSWRGWIIYFLPFNHFQQFFPNVLCYGYKDLFFHQMRNLLIVKSYCMFPIQIERKSNLWHNYKLPILSWELMQYIFIACLYKCWLLKPVLGISYWTVCIDVFFSDWHCLYILVVMVMALTLCNENEMQTVKIFCGLVKLYLNLIFFFIHFSYTYP